MTLNKGDTGVFEREPLLSERFQILSVLGQGGASIVYHAVDRINQNRAVALKLLVNDSAFDDHVLHRFKEELRICRDLNHPNLVKAYDLIEGKGVIAFTMEFIDGEDLSTLLKRGKPPTEVVETLIEQLLSAVEELHRHGIVHRDIKLENVMVRRDGVLKLTDLGLIKSLNIGGLTKTGILLGTAQYMPPEYVRHSEYDQRGDIYAVGCVLYELLTGQRRLVEKNGMEALEYLIRTNFQVARTTLNGFPKRFLPIIEGAMAVEPKVRYQSAKEMRDSLRESRASAVERERAVEVKSELSTPSALRRLAARQQMNQAAAGYAGMTRAMTKSVGASLVVLLLAVAGVYQFSHTVPAPILNLDPGVYNGKPIGIATSPSADFKIKVLAAAKNAPANTDQTNAVPPSPIVVLESTNQHCKEASIDPNQETLTCLSSGEKGSFVVVERGVGASGAPYWVARIALPKREASDLIRFE